MPKPTKEFTFNQFKHEKRNLKNKEVQDVKRYRYKGIRFGDPLNIFLQKIFKFNEMSSCSDKWTDSQIAEKVRREYREYSELTAKWQGRNGEKKVGEFRNNFNKGTIVTPLEVPEALSFRYSTTGKLIPSKISKKIERDEGYWIMNQRAKYTANLIWSLGKSKLKEIYRAWFLPDKDPLVKKHLKMIEVRSEATKKMWGKR